MLILLTAFDAFGGELVNPAEIAVRSLPGAHEGVSLEKLTLPTVYDASIRAATEAVERLSPDAVISVGQALGRTAVTPERVAVNIDDSSAADNAGNVRRGTLIVPGGPDGYCSTLPVGAIVREIRAAGIPAQISNTAGTFVCNHLLYGILHHIRTRGLRTRAGFLHVPILPEQAAKKDSPPPSMSNENIARALLAAVRAVAEDIRGQK